MRRRLVVLLVVGLIAALALPAAAVTYGEPDEDGHPYVGMILFYDPDYYDARFDDYGAWFSCSGTAVSDTVFLTAGHCAYGIGHEGASTTENGDGSGGNDVWVSFGSYDVTNVLDDDETNDFPSSWDYLPPELDPADKDLLDADRRQWFVDNGWIRGSESIPHPEYRYFGFPNTHDVGVILFESGSLPESSAVIAPEGYVDDQVTSPGHSRKVALRTVGYGIQEVYPFYHSEDSRWTSTSWIVNLKSALTDGYNIHSSNNPGGGQGTSGGSCFGDSGGPVFLEDTTTIVGIVSFGMNYNCKGADFAYRVDIEDTLDFLAGFGVTPAP